jgi:hypothetical protein
MLEEATVLVSMTLVNEIDAGVTVDVSIESPLRAEQKVPTLKSLPIVQFAVSPPMFRNVRRPPLSAVIQASS